MLKAPIDRSPLLEMTVRPDPSRDRGDSLVQVVHVVVLRSAEHGPEVLLLRRSNTGRGDGSWDCPAGRVEIGESLAPAAIRELSEEVGLVTAETDLVQVHDEAVNTDRGRVRHVFFVASHWSGSEVNRELGLADRMQWCEPTKLPSPILPFVRRGLIAALGS